ncbi:MAG TPA: type II toxin-antitoxin system VapB family antitoxin [Gammaproteobacteria bacterium]|nr:type II toxin-antitoxin system VapB family antitoxin [Gammaproteobacteria bacterium]
MFRCHESALTIDNGLLQRARRVSGIRGKAELVHAGLNALIERESARRLADLGGTERAFTRIRRRRTPADREPCSSLRRRCRK